MHKKAQEFNVGDHVIVWIHSKWYQIKRVEQDRKSIKKKQHTKSTQNYAKSPKQEKSRSCSQIHYYREITWR